MCGSGGPPLPHTFGLNTAESSIRRAEVQDRENAPNFICGCADTAVAVGSDVGDLGSLGPLWASERAFRDGLREVP